MLGNLNITDRTKVNRMPKRASYDKDTIFKILDSVFICNIGFIIGDKPYIIQTAFGRKNDFIFIHGSKNNRMMKSIEPGNEVCIAVNQIDGIVLARSAFHHSINYRSVIMYGKPEQVSDTTEKANALEIIMEHIVPGRWKEIRKPNEKELNATSVYAFKIEEASAKIRTGQPVDDKVDMDSETWAGILPLKLTSLPPETDTASVKPIDVPEYLKNYVV